ncbi:CLUMA_CG000905, isoform A [Clunio marinus]|uniref:CLUMA_CG000905, isoform A n=1 Tax=Clunio marinus TaxID=568069 RepID=A0A1J1HI05_9DIPT|nr:CLUMA_CG000905, isoform A [Clunio marinus]
MQGRETADIERHAKIRQSRRRHWQKEICGIELRWKRLENLRGECSVLVLVRVRSVIEEFSE